MTDTHDRPANETSPLVGPARGPHDDQEQPVPGLGGHYASGAEDTHDVSRTESSWYLFLLTLSIGG